MQSEPSFFVELLQRHPAGPILQVVGLVALGILFFSVEQGVPTPAAVKIAGLVGAVAFATGMSLTHKHAFKLQVERRERRAARSSAPWDARS
jgi:hypothetical protein